MRVVKCLIFENWDYSLNLSSQLQLMKPYHVINGQLIISVFQYGIKLM